MPKPGRGTGWLVGVGDFFDEFLPRVIRGAASACDQSLFVALPVSRRFTVSRECLAEMPPLPAWERCRGGALMQTMFFVQAT